MPLTILPDLLDAETHAKLDNEVTQALSHAGFGLDAEETYRLSSLLHRIVSNDDNLDRRFLNMGSVDELIEAHQELRQMLVSAWNCRSYRNIRNLDVLRASEKKRGVLPPSASILAMEKSFRAKYHGAAIDGFCEYLTQNEALFQNSKDPVYYAKFCSIVQSSGTGKSRLLTELHKKGIVVVCINLRETKDASGFPIRDDIPSRLLTTFPPIKWVYEIICYVFFIALFETLNAHLTSTRENVMDWVHRMCEMCNHPGSPTRVNFFREVETRFAEMTSDMTPPSGNCEMDDQDHSLASQLLEAHRKTAASLEKLFPAVESASVESYQPKLVIALDEAHSLTEDCGKDSNKYRPADEVCRVANKYSHANMRAAIWLVFASTTSKVSDFSPPDKHYDSARVAERGQKLFPPYTLLGWDQCATKDIDRKDVFHLDHIIRYGRPLWASIRAPLQSPVLLYSTARYKLCGKTDFDPRKTDHVLAVLGQRFAVDVTFCHLDSVIHLEKGVASHLRICLATSLDRTWRFTSYPSEPFLSCMVAIELHNNSNNLSDAMTTLLNVVNSGMVDVGQRGGLASRFLWLLAKDLYLRSKQTEKRADQLSWDDVPLDCQTVPVMDWLEFVFGKRLFGETSSNEFKDAYVNFSHWICMEKEIRTKDEHELSLDRWTRCHWERTSAVQCYHQQPLIDKVIPISFEVMQENGSMESYMSQIFIQDKARESTNGLKALSNITRRNESIGGDSITANSVPYIAILADLGRPPSFEVTFPERGVRDRCLRIYAAGCDKTTYPFLCGHDTLVTALQTLVHRQLTPEPGPGTPSMEALFAEFKFGSTTSSRHTYQR